MIAYGTQLEQGVHLLLVGQHVGLQEPELEDLVRVDGGDALMMSITWERCFSGRAATSKSNITRWLVMLLVRNFASARANHAAGSKIQNVGRVSLLGWVAGVASAAGGDWGRGRNRMLPRMVANQL